MKGNHSNKISDLSHTNDCDLFSPQCASSQLSAASASTFSGTLSCRAGIGAFSMMVRTTLMVSSTSPSGTLKDQFVMDLQQHASREGSITQSIFHADHGAAAGCRLPSPEWGR